MILQALVEYYETLAEQGMVSRQGWCKAKVSYSLNLDADGNLVSIVPRTMEEQRGKKTAWVPVLLEVPEMAARSSGVSANFLCDNSKYLLGVDKEGANKRVEACFQAAKEKHLDILASVHCEMADAIKAFFIKWDPKTAEEHPLLKEIWEEVTAGGNLIFSMGIRDAQDDGNIRLAWEESRNQQSTDDKRNCMVTGKMDEIARIHSTIKGVRDTQPSGAALVSFNAPAFESYGKEQSFNAPVGKYAAFAYTTALKHLLSQKDYVFILGDTTIVFWAQDGRKEYQDLFGMLVNSGEDNQEIIRSVFSDLTKGRKVGMEGMELNPDQRFYILGLAPNAARLAVRFFYQDTFGHILRNLEAHYKRMEIVKPSWNHWDYLGIWRLLRETVNQKSKDKNPQPNMAASVFRAILSDSRYPANLYSNTLIRIRAEQGNITPGRAAIIKAYLLKNINDNKEDNLVGLDEERNDASYVLGRIFSVLEAIQEDANPGINATIRDRYFNSACAAPASIFPILLKLKNSHIRKIEKRKRYYEILLTELLGKLNGYPKQLSLEEQGNFILGYYHQVQKRYEKKEEV